MAITAKSSGVTRKPVPAGNYFGVIVGVYDIGTQEGGNFGPKHQVVLQFELHKKKGVFRGEDGNIATISKFYNIAFSDKADLRKDTEKVLGRKFREDEAKAGYDVTQLLDRVCRLTVAHDKKEDDSIRDYIDAIMSCDEDDPEIKPETDSIVYELVPGGDFNEAVPEWIRKLVQKSQEWRDGGSRSSKTSSRSDNNNRSRSDNSGHPKNGNDEPPF